MKPERVDLEHVTDIGDLADRILCTRLHEARKLSTGLQARDRQNLHDFRIACKRLRYALERFGELDPSLQGSAQRLAELQDALGEAHDRDVLLAILPPSMPATERRLQSEREAWVDRAIAFWHHFEQTMQALDFHGI
jgi:CHAD domain-containing protein